MKNAVPINIIINGIGSLLNGLIVFVVAPLYLEEVGFSGYGLIGVWTSVTLIASILDFGIAPAFAREISNLNRGKVEQKFKILHETEKIYLYICAVYGICIAAGLLISAKTIHNQYTISKFGLASACLSVLTNFAANPYLSGLAGIHSHKSAVAIQIIVSIFKNLGGLIALKLSKDINIFFFYQANVSILQLIGSRLELSRQIGTVGPPSKKGSDVYMARLNIKTAIKIWIGSILGVVISQFDRIFAGLNFDLEIIGRYTSAVTAAAMTQMVVQPFYKVCFTHFAGKVHSATTDILSREYLACSAIVGSILTPLTICGIIYAPNLFELWIHSNEPTMIRCFRLLLLGMGMAGISTIATAIAQAGSQQALHSKLLVAALLVATPISIFGISIYGILAMPSLWIIHGISYSTIGVAEIMRRERLGKYRKWIAHTLIFPSLVTFFTVVLGMLLEQTQRSPTKVESIERIVVIYFTSAIFSFLINVKQIKTMFQNGVNIQISKR